MESPTPLKSAGSASASLAGLRIAVLSDIHANMDALSAVLADIRGRSVDRLVCLGDCVGYGAEPSAVIRCMQDLKCPTVMGNHELALRHPRHLNWFNPVARRSLEITGELLDADSRHFIEALPAVLRLWGARFVHGFPPASPTRYLFQIGLDDLHQRIKAMSERICFVGHTHQLELVGADDVDLVRRPLDETPVQLDPGRRYIVNVGSVGQPRDGRPEAKYVIWDVAADRLTVRYVPYPYRLAADKIRRAGMPETHALQLLP